MQFNEANRKTHNYELATEPEMDTSGMENEIVNILDSLTLSEQNRVLKNVIKHIREQRQSLLKDTEVRSHKLQQSLKELQQINIVNHEH